MAVTGGSYAIRHFDAANAAGAVAYAPLSQTGQGTVQWTLAAGFVDHVLGTGVYDDVILALGGGKLFGARYGQDGWSAPWSRGSSPSTSWTRPPRGPSTRSASMRLGPRSTTSRSAPNRALYIATDKGLFRAAD